MKLRNGFHRRVLRQRGFTITELMLVLGVGGLIIGGAYIGYKTVSDNNATQQNLVATSNLLAGVKNKWQGIGSYAAVTSTSVINANLVQKPLYVEGGNIKNTWAQIIDFEGSASNFSAKIAVPKDKCLESVGYLDGIAYRIDVDTAGIANNAAEDNAKTVKKAGQNIDPAKANTQCNLATTVITAWVK